MDISLVTEAKIELAIECVDVGVQKVVHTLLLAFVLDVLVLFLNSFHLIFNDDVFAALQTHAMHGLRVVNVNISVIDHGVLEDGRLWWRLVQV